MWLPQILLLFAINSVGPGFFFARRWRLSPGEKLVVSVGLSYLLVYAGAFAVFAAGLRPRWQFLVMLSSLALTLAGFGDLRRLFATRQVRRLLAVFAALLIWGTLLLSLVRGYGGGTWSGDWLEHYQRSLFFLGDTPRDFLFIDLFYLPARPPVMNVVAAHFLALAGNDYDVYQVVFLFLNALVLLPCCLIVGELLRPTPKSARRAPWVVLLLLAANPMFCQNLTYAWTKLFTAFYVLLALHLYLRAWRKGRRARGAAPPPPAMPPPATPTARRGDGSRPRFVLAFASLSTGFLVHFSAGPYAAFVGLHYLLAVWWRRKKPLAEAAVIAVVCGLILASWFAWSGRVYGFKTTVASNTTVVDAAPLSAAQNAGKIARNLLNTTIPTVLRHPSLLALDKDLKQPTLAGRVRDFAFLCYQVSVPFGLGSAGIALVGYLLYRFLIRPPGISKSAAATTNGGGGGVERLFWAAFIPFLYVVGVAVHGAEDRFGVAHICLQTLVLLGLCLVAAGWRRIPPLGRWVLLPGLALDLGVGIFLHFALQSRTFPTQGEGDQLFMVPTRDYLSRGAQANWWTKVHLSLTFWGDAFGGLAWLLQMAMVVVIGWFAWQAFRPTAERMAAPAGRMGVPGRAGRGSPATLVKFTPAKARPAKVAASRKRKSGRRGA